MFSVFLRLAVFLLIIPRGNYFSDTPLEGELLEGKLLEKGELFFGVYLTESASKSTIDYN